MTKDRYVTSEQAHEIAMVAAEEGSTKSLKRTFALLGVDLDNFESVQEFRGDLQWLKSGRRVSKAIGNKAGTSIVGAISIGILIGVFDWIKKIFFHNM